MFKRSLPLFIAFVLFFVSFSGVKAQSLQLNGIGTSSTEDKTFTTWTYVGENPTLAGEASPSAEITVQIDSDSSVVFADSSGVWIYTTSTLLEGDHDISILSDSEIIQFTLSIVAGEAAGVGGSGDDASGSVDLPTELPQTGAFDQMLLLIISGLVMIGFAMVSRAQLLEIVDEWGQ